MLKATQAPVTKDTEVITLSNILDYLNPPNQDYDRLASRAEQSIKYYQEKGTRYTAEVGMARFFFLFGRGYQYWQQNYLYNTIHEYFYGAYVCATTSSKEIQRNAALNNFFLYFTCMMIHYSRCENSVISNNPSAWEYHSAKALQFAKGVLEIIDRHSNELIAAFHEDTSKIFRSTIRRYVTTNITLYQGINTCAKVYLGASITEEQLDTLLVQAKALPSEELASEMRAHLTFAKRYLAAKRHESDELFIQHADITLRAIGSIDRLENILRVFDYFDNPAYGETNMRRELRAKAGLPVSAITLTPMQDIFETALGVENLKELEIDLTPNEDDNTEHSATERSLALAFTLNDGNEVRKYQADKFAVKVSRLGTISVEISLSVDNAFLSHLRLIETLISPHMGEISITWQDLQTTNKQKSVAQTNFIEQYLALQNALTTLRMRPGIEQPYQRWTDILQQYARFLAEAIDEPTNLSTFREEVEKNQTTDSTSPLNKEEQGENLANLKKIKQWEGYYQQMSAAIGDIRAAIIHADDASAQSLIDLLAPADVKFGYFADVFTLIFDRLNTYLAHLAAKHGGTDTYIAFDANIGWQTIVSCTHMALVDTRTTPAERDINDITTIQPRHDFRGLVVQSREARATIDDWRFTEEPKYHNRAIIRSHTTDFLVMSENRAFLFFPDDPQYIVDQYITSVRIVANLRTIAIAFNLSIKSELDQLNQLTYEDIVTRSKAKELAAYNEQMEQNRRNIETLRLRAGQTLELLRSFTLSKYQDHSDLLKALFNDANILAVRDALKENVVELDHFQDYVSGQIQKRIAGNTENAQKRSAAFLAVVAVVSAFANIETFANLIIHLCNYFGYRPPLVAVDTAIIAVLVIATLGGILIIRRRFQ